MLKRRSRFEEDFRDFEVIPRQVAELGLLSFGLERVFQVGCFGSVSALVRDTGGWCSSRERWRGERSLRVAISFKIVDPA